ncbi:YdcH family protein [Marinicella sp. W31]|uniref:YdcH family protein n=1 Tax=Marinicella sp. W31 TaxID=3023713 RepID=UPI0037578437
MELSQSEIVKKIAEFKLEHRELDNEIEYLIENQDKNELHIKRLKKRKLQLKDMITQLEDMLIPDLDA